MANWYEMGVGGDQYMDFTRPVTFNYDGASNAGTGNSYGGGYMAQNPGDVRWDDPGTGVLDRLSQAQAPNWMTTQRAAPYYPEPIMSNPGAPNMNDPWFRAGSGNPRASMSEGLPWAQPPAFRGGGGSTSIGNSNTWNPVPIRSKYLDMLSQVVTNPGSVESHPALQWIQKMGEQALARSAGARRMRFAGKTGTDFINYGQGAASQYWNQLAQTLQNSSQAELPYAKSQAEAKAAGINARMLSQDPYGQARSLAARYSNPYELSIYNNPEATSRYQAQWELGRRLNDEMRSAYG